MHSTKFQSTLSEADEMLHQAKEELCRPEEDVVHYNVCKHAYKAIEKYMTGYLIHHGVHILHSNHIKDLLGQCRKIDKKFNDLNFDQVISAEDPEKLMMNLHTAQTFIFLAEKTRGFVAEK
ncbi:HEPN domain-containing protein [Lunatibacter salilacus]|uniref:HEPN domain-containing protein n=1 Tax=Lunatibacter salilacus TaxID=2483804 RepID=UPI00131B32EB|nr:HEPN domain-containing protein [Lunatibacter salilacus]